MNLSELRVLVVEDDPDDSLVVCEALTGPVRAGTRFKVELAVRFDRAAALMAERRFDVVLLDLMLPDSRGAETILRALAAAEDAAIVVLTGLVDESLGLYAVGLGAQDYLVKDELEPAVLQRALVYAAERRRLFRQVATILEAARDAMFVVDADAVTHFVNGAGERLLGRDARELIGRPFPYPMAEGELKLVTARGEIEAEMRLTPVDWRGTRATLITVYDLTASRFLETLKSA